MVYNLQAATTNFEYVLGSMSFVFLIIVPILTMRVLPEERRQKTDQLLYSLPLSMTQVVVGKYLALLTMFLISLVIISLYPLILTAFGNLNLAAAFSSIAGFFCLGAALIAVGMYISSITESQAVAAGLCFVVMLINYFIADLTSMASATAFGSLTIVIQSPEKENSVAPSSAQRCNFIFGYGLCFSDNTAGAGLAVCPDLGAVPFSLRPGRPFPPPPPGFAAAKIAPAGFPGWLQ